METKSGMLLQKKLVILCQESGDVSWTVANTRTGKLDIRTLSVSCVCSSPCHYFILLSVYTYSPLCTSLTAKCDNRVSENDRRAFVTQEEVVLVLAFWLPLGGALLNDVVMSGSPWSWVHSLHLLHGEVGLLVGCLTWVSKPG